MPTPGGGHPANNVPEPVARVSDLMAGYAAAWCLCGGWGVDAWLGRVTRDHADVDIVVFQADLPALFDHLEGWQLIAHDSPFPREQPQDQECLHPGADRGTIRV